MTDWKSNASKPVMDEGLQYHIRCKEGDIAKYVLLPGDPDRVDMIAEEWNEPRKIANYREHRTFSGKTGEVDISACSTGAGGGSTASAFEELAALGGETFIRVGTTAALQEHISPGDLIISSGAVRHDGTSQFYVDDRYPASAHYEVTAALVEAAEQLGHTYHVGVSCSTASWYCGQGRTGFKGYEQSFFKDKVSDLNKAGVLNFEMEAATIFTLAGLYNLKAGSVCTVVANRIKDEFTYGGVEKSVQTANLAVQILAEWEKVRKERNKKYWFPSIGKKELVEE
ncbi:nucleoside phosphorylase [Fictibacillus enclensis]|uniref:nucleoside phosphorylase n=1 Tax=Fictibacillus enclensis TaxID=1017270 RepID=UPI00259FF377|nr:nucleoside phosphorylase [Fictibacillus enclensis]MDM5200930.1 nucleoside phosphorylase [Fictibacillus enclensis]